MTAYEEKRMKLSSPMPFRMVKWRLQKTYKDSKTGYIVPYLSTDAIIQWFQECGIEFQDNISLWKEEEREMWSKKDDSYIRKTFLSQKCTIKIYNEDLQCWIERFDVGTDTDQENIKGGASDAFKRAAKKFGVGIHLNSDCNMMVKITEKSSNTWAIDQKSFPDIKIHYDKVMDKILKKEDTVYTEEIIISEPEYTSKTTGNEKSNTTETTETTGNEKIPPAKSKQIYAVLGGNKELIDKVLKEFGYKTTFEVKEKDFTSILEKAKKIKGNP